MNGIKFKLQFWFCWFPLAFDLLHSLVLPIFKPSLPLLGYFMTAILLGHLPKSSYFATIQHYLHSLNRIRQNGLVIHYFVAKLLILYNFYKRSI